MTEWMHLTVHAPAGVVREVMDLLQERHGFRDISPIDWCEMEREQDFSCVSWAPALEPINRYVIDWRKGESRGDVRVVVERASDPALVEDDYERRAGHE